MTSSPPYNNDVTSTSLYNFNTTQSDNNITNNTKFYTIGVVLSICGNIIIALALNCQKLAHRKHNSAQEETKNNINSTEEDDDEKQKDKENKPLISSTSYLKYGVWWAGILLMAAGEVGNFIAYGFAPASVVAPLGSFAVIANGFIAMIMNKESLRLRDLLGTTFVVVGCFFIVQFSNQNEEILNANQIVQHILNWKFIVYMCLLIIGCIVISILRTRYTDNRAGVLLHLSLVSFVGSFTVISAKAVSGMIALTFNGQVQAIYPMFYIMLFILVITIIYQVKFLNEAMAAYDIAIVVPVNFVMFTVCAIVAGALFYDEFFRLGGVKIFLFLFGCILSVIGVIFITGDKDNQHLNKGDLHVDMLPAFIRTLVPTYTQQKNESKENIDKEAATSATDINKITNIQQEQAAVADQ